jgi:hypothetical protein
VARDVTPLGCGVAKIGRPGRERVKVLSVRVNAKEYEQLTAQAELAGVGPSTLARSMILVALNPTESHAPIDNWVASVSERLSMLEAKVGAEAESPLNPGRLGQGGDLPPDGCTVVAVLRLKELQTLCMIAVPG